jgi:CheY-like chemotaxis protein
MTLLIVDDNPNMCLFIKALVSDLSNQVYECGDGDEAFNSYAQHQQDWILMDIEMPRCDGITATRLIKKSFPLARIVIVTVNDSQEMRDAARDAGACAFLVKDNLLEIRKIISPDSQRPTNDEVEWFNCSYLSRSSGD